MQSRLGYEDAIVTLAVPIRIAIHEPAARPCTEHISQQARDVDQASDGGTEVVGCRFEQEGRDDVDCDNPGERDTESNMS
jgi:hypothetical protein